MKKLAEFYENPLVTRSKQMLTEAFFELLKETPSRKISVSKLCEKAGVARPTFYSHYDSIEDIPLAYFDQWLNDVKMWVNQIGQKKQSELLDPNNQFYYELGELLFGYWCNEVELVKKLQNAGYENVILKSFVKAHEMPMKDVVGPTYGLSIKSQNFLQSKSAIVAYELYKYWIVTEMQLSVNQLAEINFHLNSKQGMIEFKRISMGMSEEKKNNE